MWSILLAGCLRPGLPGRSYVGPLPESDQHLRASTGRIRAHIDQLAGTIGPRSFAHQPKALDRASTYIKAELQAQGYEVHQQEVVSDWAGHSTSNLIAELPGYDPPLVVGAHYDTVWSTPGADDNASGVATLLELARALALHEPDRRILWVAWTTEEPPFFETKAQGSRAHAESIGHVYAALSLEMLGTYSDAPHSQRYPFPFSLFYPNRADFVMFVGDVHSNRLVRQAGRVFRQSEDFPSRGGSGPRWIPGIDWSDHASYWAIGAPAIMVTDTSFYRNPRYHEQSDTPDTLDPERIARVVRGLRDVVIALSSTEGSVRPLP